VVAKFSIKELNAMYDEANNWLPPTPAGVDPATVLSKLKTKSAIAKPTPKPVASMPVPVAPSGVPPIASPLIK
jgi:hypothetical protein